MNTTFINLTFNLVTDGDKFKVGVWVDGVPVWHSGDTPHEALKNALESVLPVSEPEKDASNG